MVSPTVLNNLHITEGIPYSPEAIPHMYCCYPPQYCRYPSTVLNTIHSTDVILQQYWCYPPACSDISPLYWTTSTVLKLSPTELTIFPTVLSNLHSTEASPTVLKLSQHSTDVISQCTEQPQMYWITSTVLNQRYEGWFCQAIESLYSGNTSIRFHEFWVRSLQQRQDMNIRKKL